MDHREHRAGRVGAQPGQQFGVGVGHHGVDARLGQGVLDPVARAQRHLSLGGQPAGEHHDTIKFVHVCGSP